MAGNSRHPGAGNRGKGNTAGSGGRIRRSLRGKGPTPKAEDRVYHKAYKAKQEALKRQANRPKAKKTHLRLAQHQAQLPKLLLLRLLAKPHAMPMAACLLL